MFVPCPHCQFLVACPPQQRALLPADCPRCGRPLDAESTAADPAAPEAPASMPPGVGEGAQTGRATPGTGVLAFGGFALPLIGTPTAAAGGTDHDAGRPSQAQAASLRALGAGQTDTAGANESAGAEASGQAQAEAAAEAAIDPIAVQEADAIATRHAEATGIGTGTADAAAPTATATGTDTDTDTDTDADAVPEPEPDADANTAARVAEKFDDASASGTPLPPETIASAPSPASGAEASTSAAAQPPGFAAPATNAGWARFRWLLVALLALLLGLQVLIADRARLATDPGWRPLVEQVCGALGCTLPPWHEPEAFTMLDRRVQPAARDGVLRVYATFRNDARWAQDWPALELVLSDADGRVLGSHAFTPADYLGAAPTTQLSPGQSAQVAFLVQEPAPGTVAFSFGFR